MTDMAAPTQPRPIPGSNALQPPATNLAIPKSVQSLRPNYGLSVDTSSPVTQNGSYEFDRIIKSGEVLKRTRKTKSWKPIYIVLRPNLLSIYRNSSESKLRHQINLSDLTAVARQKDPKRKGKHVFGLFSPSRNFHLEANTDSDAQDWVERIRDAARMDEHEEEISLASPGGAQSTYKGFERSRRISPQAALASDDRSGGYSSSDAEAFGPSSYTLPKRRDRNNRTPSARRPSQIDYSGAEGYGSYSDFSDSLGPTAPMSALSLSTDSRPATSSAQQHTSPTSNEVHSVYGPVPKRPMASQQRNPSQLSTNQVPPDSNTKLSAPQDSERVVYHNWILLLRPKHGVRQWKKVWMVVRPKALALYKNEDEYRPLLILPFEAIIDAVEIDPISKSKEYCIQVISEERNYRFCAVDEESLNRWLGAFKSVLSRRRAASKDYGTVGGAS